MSLKLNGYNESIVGNNARLLSSIPARPSDYHKAVRLGCARVCVECRGLLTCHHLYPQPCYLVILINKMELERPF